MTWTFDIESVFAYCIVLKSKHLISKNVLSFLNIYSERIDHNVELVNMVFLFRAPSMAPVVSLSMKRYPYCLVLVGSRNGFERDFTIELNEIEGLMEGWLKCQISPLVKYRQNQNTQKNGSCCINVWVLVFFFFFCDTFFNAWCSWHSNIIIF